MISQLLTTIFSFVLILGVQRSSFYPPALQSIEVKFSPLTLEQIFHGNHQKVDNTVTLIATGDVMLGRVVNQKSIAANNFTWPFEKTAEMLKNSDIALINLEGPITNDCKTTGIGMVFCADKRSIQGLTFARIDVANLANNHIGNHGENGTEYTKEILKSAGVIYSGANEIAYKEVGEVKFAFLGYNGISPKDEGVNWAIEENITREVKKAKENADVVIVSFHWGIEYKDQPTKQQVELGHLAIDSGADLVVGNHPHWFQPVEVYKDKIITYSHGNFIFDQMWSQRTKEGVVGKYIFSGSRLVDVEFIPVIIENFGQPRIANEEEKNKILNHMEKESVKLKNKKTT